MSRQTLFGTVLMTTDTVGGVWDYSLQLASSLMPFGVETILATMGPRPSCDQRERVKSMGLFLEESDFLLEWMPGCEADLRRAGSWLLQLERRFCPDLIHLNGYTHAVLPWHAPCLVVAHSCVLSWWQAVKRSPLPPEWNAYARRVRRGLRQASALVAPTQAMFESLQCFYGSFPNARIIWNGRNPGDFRPEKKEEFVFTAGRLWDEAKNISSLDAIADQIPWPVLTAGQTRHPAGNEHKPDHLHHLGLLSPQDMTYWLGRAAIYALPARYEPFGLSALEAAMSGCALVLGDIPTLRELWEDAALFVSPDDPAALKSAILELITEPRLRRELADRACQRAAKYSADRMALAYLALYGEFMKQGEETETYDSPPDKNQQDHWSHS